MKRLFLVAIVALVSIVSAQAKSDLPEYQIQGAGTGSQGSYLVEVSVMVPKVKKADDALIGRCAVHGVLFRGFSNKEMRQSQKPLAGSASVEASHDDYFTSFFSEGGAANNYVEVVSSSRTVVKVGKKYKVTAKVTVNKEQLHKDLEAAGVIKGLNSIF